MIIALDLRAEGVGSSTSPTTVLCVLPSQGLSLFKKLKRLLENCLDNLTKR